MTELNLQFFGGRGASSGGGSGGKDSGYVIKTENGETLNMYFSKQGGKTYYSNTINGIPEPTPNNWTEKQMIDRITENGGTITKKTKADLRREYSNYQQGRKETNAILDRAYVSDSTFVRGSRADRIRRRASRRRI